MNNSLLYAPKSYWESSKEERDLICNGCGAKGGLPVPNKFYGLCIKEACQIHDWMYHYGKTLMDKLFADAIFRMNLTILIDANSNYITGLLRHRRASTYYIAVAEWGNTAFWINKSKNEGTHITFQGEFKINLDYKQGDL